MLEDNIEVTGWRAQWLERKLPALQWYFAGETSLHALLIWVIIVFSIITSVKFNKLTKAARANGETVDRDTLLDYAGRYARIDRSYFVLALITMIHAMTLMSVDGYVAFTTLIDNSPAIEWNKKAVLELGWSAVLMFAIYVVCHWLVPMAQIALASYVLTHAAAKAHRQTLQAFIAPARSFSSSMCLFWCMISLFVTLNWSPVGETLSRAWGLFRYSIVLVAYGSALVWLEAAFAFNFRAKRLADKNLQFTYNGLGELLVMVGETVVDVHTADSKKPLLPIRQDLPAPFPSATDEKEALKVSF